MATSTLKSLFFALLKNVKINKESIISTAAKNNILPFSVHPQSTWKTVRILLLGQGLCLIIEIKGLTCFCDYIWESLGTES